MSVDGTGILESDLAHGVYNKVLDLFDSGLDYSDIENSLGEFEEWVNDDEFDRDIYLTAKAQAYWEIGLLPNTLIKQIKSAIDDEKGMEEWKDCSEEDYQQRKEVLKAFFTQISSPNKKPRARKVYKKIDNKLFEVGDCLLLNILREKFKGLVIDVSEYRGVCEYHVAVVTPETKESIEGFRKGHLIGHKILSTIHDGGFVYGASFVKIDHEIIKEVRENIKVVGNLDVDSEKMELGSYSGSIDLRSIRENFEGIIDQLEQKIVIDGGNKTTNPEEKTIDDKLSDVPEIEYIRNLLDLPESTNGVIKNYIEGPQIERIFIADVLID